MPTSPPRGGEFQSPAQPTGRHRFRRNWRGTVARLLAGHWFGRQNGRQARHNWVATELQLRLAAEFGASAPRLQLKRLSPSDGLPLPAYATAGAAGLDICSAENLVLEPSTTHVVATGFAVAVPEGWELQCRSRSGLAANKAVHVLNSPGTIDSDYRGEIKVILRNSGFLPVTVHRGDRIAQLVPKLAPRLRVVEVAELDATARGAGGFGSTGS